MKQTNLQMIKDVAKGLFDAVKIEASKEFSFIVQHPFVSSNIVQVKCSNSEITNYKIAIHKLLSGKYTKSGVIRLSKSSIDYLENLYQMSRSGLVDVTIEEGRELFRNQIFKFIDEAKSITDILMLVNKPWYMTFIKYTEAYMSDEDLGDILGDCWVEQEYPSKDCNASLKEIIGWFKRADRTKLMTWEENLELTHLRNGGDTNSNILTVYRGVSFDGKPEGLSWTTDLEKARWFANRFKSDNPKVYKMEIDLMDYTDSILAYFSNRGESEVVIDTTRCYNWEVLE